jgi:hypothetical protein
MFDKEFVITISDFEQNKTSSRKGNAFELLVEYILQEGSPIPVQRQLTIRKSTEEYCKPLYSVQKKFYVSFKESAKKGTKVIEYPLYDIFDSSIIQNKTNLILNYRSKKNKKEKFADGSSLLNFLIVNEFLTKTKAEAIFQKIRLDLGREIYGKFCFLECKDRGKSYLRMRDINQIVSYVKVLKENLSKHEFGYVNLELNGYAKNFEKELERTKQDHGIEIRLHHIKDRLIRFARKNGVKIDCLVFSKHKLEKYNFKIMEAGKKSKLYLNIHTSPYREYEIYKPIEQLISDDFVKIKKFLEQKRIVLDTSLKSKIIEKQLVV